MSYPEINDFDKFLNSLINALDKDIDYIDAHKRLLVQALEWERNDKKNGFLLKQDSLERVEAWLEKSRLLKENVNNKLPMPTDLQLAYVERSRSVEKANQEAEKILRKAAKTGTIIALACAIIGAGGIIASSMYANTQKQQAAIAKNDALAQGKKADKANNDADKANNDATIAKNDALAQGKKADKAKNDAAIAKNDALAQGKKADKAKNDADKAKNDATIAKNDALAQGKKANKAKNDAAIAKNDALAQRKKADKAKNDAAIAQKKAGEAKNNLESTKIQTLALAAKARLTKTPNTIDALLLALKAGGQLQKHLKLSTGVSTEIQQPIKEVLQQAQQTVQERYSFAGHKGFIIAASYSPNGRVLATSSEDKTVILWDALTGKKLHTLIAHDGFVNSISFSSDGKVLASGSTDGKIIFWNVETGKNIYEIKPFKKMPVVNSVSFSSDGKTFAAAGKQGDIILWKWVKGELKDDLILQGDGYGIYSISFSPDGRDLASGKYGGEVTIWNLDRRTRETKNTTLPLLKDDAFRVAFSPDSKNRLLAAADTKGNVILWDFSEQKSYDLVGHKLLHI